MKSTLQQNNKPLSLGFALAVACLLLSSQAFASTSQPQPKPIAQLLTNGKTTVLKFSPKGTLLGCISELPASGNGKFGPRHSWRLQVWDVRTRKMKWSVTRPEIIYFDFSPDGTRLAFLETRDHWTHWGQKIQVCRAPSGTLLRTIPLPDGTWGEAGQERLQFGPDNRTLSINLRATQKTNYKSSDGTPFTEITPWMALWFDSATGKRLRSMSLPEYLRYDAVVPITTYDTSDLDAYRQPNDIFLSPDGQTILADLHIRRRAAKNEQSNGVFPGTNLKHQLWLCDSKGKFLRQLTDETRLVQGFSSTGKLFACTDDPRRLQIYDVEKGRLRRTLAMPPNYNIPIQELRNTYQPSHSFISRDGKRAFVTITPDDKNKDTRVGEWDMASGQLLRVFGNWGTGSVSSSLALSGDDTILAHLTSPKDTGYDNRIQLWRLK